LKARSQIRRLKKSEMEKLAQEALNMQTTEQVMEAVKAATNQ
jgi:phosphoenolpyruvate-protein phosphotransferase (PTS system enzyme I)